MVGRVLLVALDAVSFSRLTSFVATAAVLLALNLSASDKGLYGDAANYWALAQTFIVDGQFSLLAYSDPLRGYSLPLLLCGVQQFAQLVNVDPVLAFRVVSAIAGAALFAVAVPSFLIAVFGSTASTPSVLIFSALAVVYWHGHLLQPLSDVPALLFLATGLGLVPLEPGTRVNPWRWCGTGACLGLAANMRPVYEVALFAGCALLVWHVLVAVRARRHVAAVASIVGFTLGVTLALSPQAFINRRVQGTVNPLAHAAADARRPNLYVQQLAWGIAMQKYETNIGTGFPPSVIFLDSGGVDLMQIDPDEDPRVSLGRTRLSVRSYLRLVAAHPIFFAGMYGRHLFNGLDVAYAAPYVPRLVPRSIPFALLNYVVLSVAVVGGAVALRRLRLRQHAWPAARLAAFLLPAVLAIPTAVEPRFFLAPWLTLYGLAMLRLLQPDDRSALIRPRWLPAVVIVLIIGAFALASNTYNQIQNMPQSVTRWCTWCR